MAKCGWVGCKKRGKDRQMYPNYYAILCKSHYRKIKLINGATILGAAIVGGILSAMLVIISVLEA